MNIKGYNIDLEKAVKIINTNDYKNIFLQVPEGLKHIFKDFVDFIEEKTKANIVISADPCFGACDIPDIKVDLLIQWGHSEWL